VNLRKLTYVALMGGALAFAMRPAVSFAQHAGEPGAAAETALHESDQGDQHGIEHAGGEHESEHGGDHEHGPGAVNIADFNARDAHGNKQPPLVASLINFAILLVILFFATRRAINPALADRRAAIEAEIGEAQRLRAEAEAMHREYAERLEKMEDEMATMRAEFQKAGEAEYKRIIDEANVRADRTRKEGEFAIQQEMKQLRDDLMRQAVLAAAESAEKAVRTQISPQDQARLADAYLSNLESQKGGSA
jgi:F-type H+-transporting ATPase subunit b